MLGMHPAGPMRRLLKVLLLLALIWLPIFVLSLIAGHAFSGHVKVPFLDDPETNGRLLAVVPLLELAVGIVGASIAVQVRSFLVMDLVPAPRRSEFHAVVATTIRRRESNLAEGVLCILACVASLVLRLGFGLGAGESSWERVGTAITLAGWWNMLVSLPVLYFLLLRWIWTVSLWAHFLFRASRLDLKLTATHPDRVGGLGFLAWGVASFAPLLSAMSAMAASGFTDEIYHQGVMLADLKYDIGTVVVTEQMIVYVPLVCFIPTLFVCRFKGLLDFGKLVLDHDRDFEEKWLEHGTEHRSELLGAVDIQSMADAGTCYAHIDEMWPFLFDLKAFAVLAIAALLPFASLLPVKEALLRLGELLI